VFIDETWTKTNMAPLRGWAPRGKRLKAKVPHGHWKTMTFLAALRHDHVAAPWLIDGPINGERFRLYIEKVLVPTLRPSDIVIMDNLGSHKGKIVRRLIRAAGAKLIFLPKYSPDLNPIEQLFAKLKHRLRKAARRTADAVCNAIGQILGSVGATECTNYFSNAGYGKPKSSRSRRAETQAKASRSDEARVSPQHAAEMDREDRREGGAQRGALDRPDRLQLIARLHAGAGR
jgi:transposase